MAETVLREGADVVVRHAHRVNALVDGTETALWTTARLGVVSPPMKRATPTIPSLPTTAISADAPSAMT